MLESTQLLEKIKHFCGVPVPVPINQQLAGAVSQV